MKNIKKDLPVIIGVVAATSLACVTGGLVNSATMSILGKVGSNIGTRLAANYIYGFNPGRIKRWFVDIHPDDLNHSIKKLFVASVNEALHNISILFDETKATEAEKKEADRLIKILQKQLPGMLMDSKQIQFDETEIKQFLYEKGDDEMICNFVEKQFNTFGIDEPFKSFLAQNLSPQLQLCFGEGLKDPANQNAWIAFQRMLTEEIRHDIKQIADTQQSIKDDLSDLKFEKAGFSEEQMAEIRELVKILNDKKLIEVKIKNGLDESLKSLESKANEVIKITTKTQITVEELKTLVEKSNRQKEKDRIIIYILAACLFIAGAFIGYNVVKKPFTTTVKVVGWESEQHNPLNGKGSIVLTLGDKMEKAEISRQGEAIFKSVPSKYDGKMVTAHLTDTEGEPYFLPDSMIKIQKNNTTKVQVLLRGLEKLQGTVFDNVSGEGVPEVMVTVAGISGITDSSGYFSIDIPIEKQRQEQKIVISKEGYESKRETISMTGEYNVVLRRK
ncbi:MAG: carboxypeptidase-like regulatory domain-containing protein [Bacteroidetes bacterium]|nr:carboxypeptidase-like regulatory domain-containing protein [Bacteroidota bacterium]MCL2302099.1 carboxypeptidase-like regulatory domain-containing protein [Lentimicrobiaceae bacterium]